MTGPARPDIAARFAGLRRSPTPVLARAVGAGGGAALFSASPGSEASPSDDGMVEERAAILQHDAGWSREEAETLAVRMAAMRARRAGPEEWADLDREVIARERSRAGLAGP